MYTYLGIDNLQSDKLILVCKSFHPEGKIKRLWREKLRGAAVIRAFFSYLAGMHAPIAFATTRVKHDPGGVLMEHRRRGGLLRQYYPNELGPPPLTVPPIYRRAEQLVTKTIHDEQLPMLVRSLRHEVAVVDSKIISLCHEARALNEQIDWLETELSLPQPDCEIPF